MKIPTFKTERARTAWWGKELRIATGMTYYQYRRLLDVTRGKTELYNVVHKTNFNAAQLLYNKYKYGADLSPQQQAVLDLPSVGHTHKAGVLRIQEASKGIREKVVAAGAKAFLESAGIKKMRDESERRTKIGDVNQAKYKGQYFWQIYDKIEQGRLPVSEGWNAARKITEKVRSSDKKQTWAY